MPTVRYMTLTEIRREKLSRSRSWFKERERLGKFPRPLPGTNLYAESEADAAITRYLEEARQQAQAVAQSTKRASAARTLRREAMATA